MTVMSEAGDTPVDHDGCDGCIAWPLGAGGRPPSIPPKRRKRESRTNRNHRLLLKGLDIS